LAKRPSEVCLNQPVVGNWANASLCRSPTVGSWKHNGIGDFEGTTPPFLPEEFFNGRLEGWGVLESLAPAKRPLGTHEQTVHFTEIYRFDAGHQDNLRWTIRKLGRGVYRGAEAGSVGEAVGSKQAAPSK
jgi:hypothetical protein